MNMSLGGFLGRDQIIPALRATNRWEAIDELIANLITTGKLKPEHREAVTGAICKRERSMSTGIGKGIGLPHSASDRIDGVIGAFGRSQPGINFDALDEQPVHLVVLFLVPQGQVQKHLHAMADIARLLHKEDFRRALDQAPDADAILQIIRSRQIS